MPLFKRILSCFILISLCFSFFSCSEEVFSYCELRLPLPDDFEQITDPNFDATYSNGNYAVAVLRISFVAAVMEGIPETMSVYEFGEMWLERSRRDANLIKDGVVYCEYNDRVSGVEYFYVEAFYRSAYAYFVILFTTSADLEDTGRVDFLKYAENLYFKT